MQCRRLEGLNETLPSYLDGHWREFPRLFHAMIVSSGSISRDCCVLHAIA